MVHVDDVCLAHFQCRPHKAYHSRQQNQPLNVFYETGIGGLAILLVISKERQGKEELREVS